MKKIIPHKDLKSLLLKVRKPGRYVGGEYGAILHDSDKPLKVALCFPDMYEIGMSNLAIRLLYNLLNSIEGVQCERVFAPAPDFEEQLKSNNVPLYSLETGIPLCDFDIIAFSFSYELEATNMLAILDTGNVEILKDNRSEGDPVIIAGGPAITNPIPFGGILDIVFLGEGEQYLRPIFEKLVAIKKGGGSRQDMIALMGEPKNAWFKGKSDKTVSTVWSDFANIRYDRTIMPVPSVDIVQDHGVVEVMRGCPNGCRFCHAGIMYRPKREKSLYNILREVYMQITQCGYETVSLASLSSGDFSNIECLLKLLNNHFSKGGVSFNLPSLKINSFTLDILEELSKVKKAGLTFAVETPTDQGQLGLNKDVGFERIMKILDRARNHGWRLAKFYFMLGLPVSGDDEADKIIEYINKVQHESKMNINVNIGTFIPKPHTPFQWSGQLDEETAFQRISYIRNSVKNRRVKIGFHSPAQSYVEGLIARGDERVGDILMKAYKKGARLDAWSEYFDRRLWNELLDEEDWDVKSFICDQKSTDDPLPWGNISLGTGTGFLKTEFKKSLEGEVTSLCDINCDHLCGVCNSEKVVENSDPSEIDVNAVMDEFKIPLPEKKMVTKVLFTFSKTGPSIYLSHLNVAEVFRKSFKRAGMFIKYSEGFNPKPKLNFAHPLSLGVTSEGEVALVEVYDLVDKADFMKINEFLPPDMQVSEVLFYNEERKVQSIMSKYFGSKYELSFSDGEYLETTAGKLDAYVAENDLSDIISFEKRDKRIILQAVSNKKPASLKTIMGYAVGETFMEEPGIDYKRLCMFAGDSVDNYGSFGDYYGKLGFK